MKFRYWTAILVLGAGLTAQAGIIYSGTGGIIPDGNTTGWSATATVSDYLSSISEISVTFDISGGYNGDLYAYLSYGGVLVPLLNRVGTSGGDSFGYGNTGFAVTLSDRATQVNNIHWYQTDSSYPDSLNINGQLTDTWRPDGGSLSSFNNVNPNGTWTIFFADLSAGGGTSTLNSWSLNINAVPEPVNVALGIFAGVVLVVVLVRSNRVRNWIQRRRAAVVEWINAV